MARILVEREQPLAALRAALDEARAGRGTVALVTGVPGVGKTALLTEATRDAAGVRVLRACGHELERSFAYGMAIQLLGDLVASTSERQRARLFAGAAGLAEPIVSPATAPPLSDAATPRDATALAHGLHWLVSNLADLGPLALVIDDAHWADAASLGWLAYLAERVADLPVALLVGAREGAEAEDASLAAIRTHAARVVALAPLSRAGVDAVAGAGAAPGFAAACAEVTGGNPFLLRDLLDDLHRQGLPLTPDTARAARPERVTRRMEARLTHLGDDARACAQALAILERAPRKTVAALAGLPAEAAEAALGVLTRVALITEGAEPRFSHPLLRAAVAEGIGPATTARLHARAAELLEAAGLPAERVAPHVVAGGGGTAADVERLRRAAREAAERGAPAEAARLLRHALALPGAPTTCVEGVALRAELGRAAVAAGLPEGAELLAEASDAAAAGGDAALAVELAIAAARRLLLAGGTAASADLLERRLADGLAPELDREVRIVLLGAVHMDPSLAGRIAERAEDLLPPGTPPRTHAERVLVAASALTRLVTGAGTVADTVPLARLAWGDGRLLEEEGPEGPTVAYVTGVLAAGGALAEDERIAGALLSAARARGSVVGAATASYVRSVPRLFAGDLVGALADAEAALDVPAHAFVAAAMLVVTRARIELDDAAPAATLLATFDPEDPTFPPLMRSAWWGAVARLRLATGDATGALAAAETMRALAGPVFLPYVADHRLLAAEALTRLDRIDEAERHAAQELALQRAWGAPGRVGVALTTLALVRGGDVALLEEAVAALARSEDRLDHVAALVALGSARLTAGDAAADPEPPLREALDTARALGARRLERLARHALVAAGHAVPAPPISESLTPPERRVCELAALGLDDREIAQALFVSVGAVRADLRTALEKLGVPDRAALHRALRAA